MGYFFAIGKCGQCGRAFTFNPDYVPSLHGQVFCKQCIEAANPFRLKNGLEAITPHPQAYEPGSEQDI